MKVGFELKFFRVGRDLTFEGLKKALSTWGENFTACINDDCYVQGVVYENNIVFVIDHGNISLTFKESDFSLNDYKDYSSISLTNYEGGLKKLELEIDNFTLIRSLEEKTYVKMSETLTPELIRSLRYEARLRSEIEEI